MSTSIENLRRLAQRDVKDHTAIFDLYVTVGRELEYLSIKFGMDPDDIINLLGKHQGFSVSGNGTDTFTLTASDSQRSVEGINKVTVMVDPKTYVPSVINILFSEELGDISAKVQVISYKPGQTFDKSTFTCPVQKYKDADIIDLR